MSAIHCHREVLLLAALFSLTPWVHGAQVVTTTRGIDIPETTSIGDACNFTRALRFQQLLPLDGSATTSFANSQAMNDGINVFVDELNQNHCGVSVGGENYSIVVKTYDGSSDTGPLLDNTMQAAVNGSDFVLGGFESAHNEPLARYAQAQNTLMITGGNGEASTFTGRDLVFGTLPSQDTGFVPTLEKFQDLGITNLSYVYEEVEGSPELEQLMCETLGGLVGSYGITVVSNHSVPKNPTQAQVEGAVATVKDLNPNAVISCLQMTGCNSWVAELKAQLYAPKANVLTSCVWEDGVGSSTNSGTDADYFMGLNFWGDEFTSVDAATGMSFFDFVYSYSANSPYAESYYAATGATAVSILAQAIEGADSLDPQVLKTAILNGSFPTFLGTRTFEPNGQLAVGTVALLQIDNASSVNRVYPATTSPEPAILFPMPTWEWRACVEAEACSGHGTCQDNGSCQCDKHYVPSGYACVFVPHEDKQHMPRWARAFGLTLVCVNWGLSLGAIAWTVAFWDESVVAYAQPAFLVLIALGCMVSTSAILTLMVDDGHELVHDFIPSGLACQLEVWLYGIGFALTFSALFAKVWRVKALFTFNEANFHRPNRIPAEHVLAWVVGAVLVEAAFLAVWHLDAPLRWTRICDVKDTDGYCLESAGFCSNPDAWPFLIVIIVLHGSVLSYACFLCYQIRDVPTNVAEGGWIAMCLVSNFQILLLAVPLLFLVHKFPTIRYVIASLAIFLNDGSVVCLVFGPKIWAVAHGKTVRVDPGEIAAATPHGW